MSISGSVRQRCRSLAHEPQQSIYGVKHNRRISFEDIDARRFWLPLPPSTRLDGISKMVMVASMTVNGCLKKPFEAWLNFQRHTDSQISTVLKRKHSSLVEISTKTPTFLLFTPSQRVAHPSTFRENISSHVGLPSIVHQTRPGLKELHVQLCRSIAVRLIAKDDHLMRLG